MVKKLVNGEIKDLTDVTIGGIKVYKCTPSKGRINASFSKDNINEDLKYNKDNISENLEVEKEDTEQKSVLGSMSIFN
jgi:hypothetical protein